MLRRFYLTFIKRQSGALVFVALWVLVILAIFSLAITNRISSEVRLAKYLKDGIISLYLAKAAVNLATLELEKDKTPDYDTLYELKSRQKELGTGSFQLNMIDEESFLNINNAVFFPEILQRLFGLSQEESLPIIEAMREYGIFKLKEELLLVDKVTLQLYSQFKDLITTYSAGSVNINTASSSVLRVLGLEDSLINIILEYRKGGDGLELTEDDRIFKDKATIIQSLREFTPLSLEQELKILELVSDNLLDVRAKSLQLNVATKVNNRPVKTYTIVLTRDSGKIKSWQER